MAGQLRHAGLIHAAVLACQGQMQAVQPACALPKAA
jgi:hypothetical protein